MFPITFVYLYLTKAKDMEIEQAIQMGIKFGVEAYNKKQLLEIDL